MKGLREDIGRLYTGRFNAYCFKGVNDSESGITSLKKELYLENIPCRLSYGNSGENNRSRFPTYGNQTAVLFTAPDAEILDGSEVIVFQNGCRAVFEMCGKAEVYYGHRQYVLRCRATEAAND